MKKIMLATTALFALSGISVAAADISISGHVRFHYDSWSDDKVDKETESGNNNNAFSGDLQLWVKGETVTDSGVTYGAAIRLRDKGDATSSGSKDANQNNVDRRYLTVADDWGKITLGRQWAPSYSMSLAQDWRGTISYGGGDSVAGDSGLSTDTFVSASTSGRGDKVIYETPNLGGFKAGISFADAGSASKGNSTEYAVQYGMSAMGDGNIKVGYAAAKQNAANNDADSTETQKSELGIEASVGGWTVSAVQFGKKVTPNKTTTKKVEDQTGQELEVAYKASDSVTLNLVHFTNKLEKSKDYKDDKYKSTGVGVKYTIAPGLYTSLGYKKFDYTNAKDKKKSNGGNTIRIRVHASY